MEEKEELASLKLYNSMTKKKEELCPIDGQHVKMYTCGPKNLFQRSNMATFIKASGIFGIKGQEVLLVSIFIQEHLSTLFKIMTKLPIPPMALDFPTYLTLVTTAQ